MKSRKYFWESLWEGILKLSGSVTSIAIILIIIFLFSEGFSLFSSKKIEDGYSILVNKNNKIEDVSSSEIKKVFDMEIVSWKELGVDNNEDEITVFRIDNIETYATEEEMILIEEDVANVGVVISRILEDNPGMIAQVPKNMISKGFTQKELDLGHFSIREFFTLREWFPTALPVPQFGVVPIIMGTLWVSLGAILLALPFGLAASIYMAELSNSKVYRFMKPIIELLSGIPSVVYGFFGLIVIVPMIQKIFNLPVGESGLAGSIVLAIMALPTIITISEDALRSVPIAMKEASLALGANKWQTILKVSIPYSISGITAAVVLGIGRAIGETMAVLMVTGNAAVMPNTLLEPLRTIPATIAAELGEAPEGGAHYQALFVLGGILFIMTLLINLLVEYISSKNKYKTK
ncbi:MAG: phosphate ABC transporter permease subunit PstC [Bacteroidales bacterium]